MAAPYGDGRFAHEPPLGSGVDIRELFHIVKEKTDDPGINSRVDSQYPNVAIITFDNINQFGGMWSKKQLDLTLPFHTKMSLHLGHEYNKSGRVADGMTFAMHNDPDGINAIGGAGEGLGVYRGRRWIGPNFQTATHGSYLKNSLVIEFDTYRNLRADQAFVDDPGTRESAHCSLLTPKTNFISTTDHRNTFFFTATQNWVEFEVTWTPNDSGGGTLNYSFNHIQRKFDIKDVTSIFKDTKVYWGFTGSTGQYTSVQAAAITTLPEQGVTAKKTVKNANEEDIDQGVTFPGDTIQYTIKVTANQMFAPIGPIIIDDNLSEYVEYVEGAVKVTTQTAGVYDVFPTFSGTTMKVATGHSLTKEGDWIEITFSVKVKDTSGGGIIHNQAVITAESLVKSQKTNTTKVSIFADPGKSVSNTSDAGQDGSAVKTGDKITYNISYGNDDTTTGTITIIDSLADGVDFESASDSGSYEGASHTVKWIIPNVASGTGGIVSVVLRVNETAAIKVENYATVQIGGHRPRITNTVVNPVVPESPIKMVSGTSEAGQDGAIVKTGEHITYDVNYLNYQKTAATVVITDSLPDGTDFLSATNGGEYDKATHTVTWILADVPSGVSGLVSLVVQVNENAVVRIENYAVVQVDGGDPLDTNIVINPVAPNNPKKMVSTNSTAGQGGAMVKTGDRITYDITFSNYQETAVTVVITDSLSDGVDFVSATNGGVYDEASRTVTWTLASVPSSVIDTVSLVVQVNQNAVESIQNYATVRVGDDNPTPTNIVVNPIIIFKCPDISKKTSRVCRKTITGCKIWADNDNVNNTRPASVEIVLLRDGEVYRRKTIDSTGDEIYIFSSLPVWKNSEDRYNYKIDELDVPDNYSKTIEGYDVINTLTKFDF